MEFHLFSQVDISGTWYVNGRQDLTRTIFQNEDKIVFYAGTLTSTGNFTNDHSIYATEWKKAANLTAGNTALIWENQLWTRDKFSAFPVISGEWTLSNNPEESYTITQDNIFCTISYKGENIFGYFIEKNKVAIPKWNNISAILSTDGTTLTWDNQIWVKKGRLHQESLSGKKLCRLELSTFYMAAQTLGRVWAGFDTKSTTLNQYAVATMDKQLAQVEQSFQNISWLSFEQHSINQLRLKLSGTSTKILMDEMNNIVNNLQLGLQNLPANSEQSLHPLALYTAGIHLGASQTIAANTIGLDGPLTAESQSILSNHLSIASQVLTNYKECISGFDFNLLNKMNLINLNNSETHTQILDIGTKLLWAVTLSDCCYQVLPVHALAVGKSECDENCKRYCFLQGKAEGKFNYKADCLKGEVIGGSQLACDCW